MVTTLINRANLTASTKTGNVLSGDINEFVPYNARVNVYVVSSAAGVNISIYGDSDIVIDDKEIVAIGTTINTTDHFLTGFLCRGGTRLACFLRETAAAATTDVLLRFDIDPL